MGRKSKRLYSTEDTYDLYDTEEYEDDDIIIEPTNNDNSLLYDELSSLVEYYRNIDSRFNYVNYLNLMNQSYINVNIPKNYNILYEFTNDAYYVFLYYDSDLTKEYIFNNLCKMINKYHI